MVTHANGSFIFNVTAMEQGQFLRVFRQLPPLESKHGLMCNLLYVQAQGHVKDSLLLAFGGEDEMFKPTSGHMVSMYEPVGRCWKCVRLTQSILPCDNGMYLWTCNVVADKSS